MSVDHERRVGRIEWGRPDVHNAFTLDMAQATADAFVALEADDDIVTIVLCGAGPDLTVGLDAAEGYDIYRRIPGGDGDRVVSQRARLVGANSTWWGTTGLFSRIALTPKVTVLRAQGRAYGVGLYLATICDLVVAADNVRFGHPAWTLVGVNGDIGLLIEAIGLKRANEIALLGRTVEGREALEWGLVDEMVPSADLDAAEDEMVTALSTLLRDGITFGTFPRNSILQKTGLGFGFARAAMAEATASNIHHRPGEFNFLKARRDHGVAQAIALAKAHYQPADA